MSPAPPPRPGEGIAWWSEGTIGFAVVVSEEKGKLVIVTEGGREQRIPPARVAHLLGGGPAPERTPEGRKEAGRRTTAIAARVRERAAGVEVSALWELVREAGDSDDRTLASLAVGDDGPEAAAALSSALIADGLHFVRRQDRWVPRTTEQLAELSHQRERERRRASEHDAAHARLAAAARGETVRFGETDAERRWLRALEEVAIHGPDAGESARQAAAEALEASGLVHDRPAEGAFRLLRRMGVFDSDDENLAILRHGLRTDFPDAVLDEARQASDLHGRSGRLDLTGLPIVTIDGSRTREIDDGLSVEPLPGGAFRIGIHIADASAFVPSGGAVDLEAYARGVTHYFPDRRLPMIPEAISEGAASLVAGEERPALSFLVEVGPDGEVGEVRLVRSIVRARARLDYDEADAILESRSGPWAEGLVALLDAAARLEARRVAAGAARIRALEAEVFVEADGRLTVERRDPYSPSHRLVSEAMVLAGTVAARWCAERGIPAIHRRQAPPESSRPLPTNVPDPVVARAMRRRMRRAEIGIAPGPHAGLGVAAYIQVTSPLRRYQDLVMHRQIAAVAAGGAAPYDEDALRGIAATTEAAESRGRWAERERDRYWMLRHLERQTGRIVDAIVVETEPRCVVHLTDTLVEDAAPALSGAPLGAAVRVAIHRVNPRADLLVLRPV